MRTVTAVLGSVLMVVWISTLRGGWEKVDPDKLPPAAEGKMDFVKDIKPILDRSCVRCHNSTPPRPNKQFDQGGLRLDNREAAMKGGESGVVIVPGKGGRSRLIHVVAGLDPVVSMPPRGKDRLSKEDIGKLRAWIDQGAAWPE